LQSAGKVAAGARLPAVEPLGSGEGFVAFGTGEAEDAQALNEARAQTAARRLDVRGMTATLPRGAISAN